MKYPEKIRKYIYTTNVAENFNRRIEHIRVRLSGYFQSEELHKLKFAGKEVDDELKEVFLEMDKYAELSKKEVLSA